MGLRTNYGGDDVLGLNMAVRLLSPNGGRGADTGTKARLRHLGGGNGTVHMNTGI